MYCERCGKENAVVTVTINGQTQRLCSKCYSELYGSQLAMNISNPMAALMNMLGGQGFEMPYSQSVQCPSCGMSYRQFEQDGKFGCANCYSAFEDYLEPLFRKIHFSAEHRGKVPKGSSKVSKSDRLSILNAQKQEAVEREDYERAAVLQREINAITEKGEQQ